MTDNCNRPLTRATRQLFRRDASYLLLHYFGSSHNSAWRQSQRSSITSSARDINDFATRDANRQRIPLVDNQEDKLSDEEWFQLLAYAIDNSAQRNNDNHHFCPLHPKHDMYLKDDLNSFVIQRRYRFGTKNFGGLSLPLLGRAARALLWLEERDMHHQSHATSSSTNKRYTGNSVHLFQCGYCQKTFLSRYYLDRHMDLHHRHLSDNNTQSNNDEEVLSICPADHVCDPLGGISACTEIMNQISPYWGRGTMLGKEYVDSTRESLFSSSIHQLLDHFHPDPLESVDDDDDDDNDADEQPIIEKEMPQQYDRRVREGDLTEIVGEMRHRSSIRNKRLLKTLLMNKQTKQNSQQLLNEVQSGSSIDAHDNNMQDENDDAHNVMSTACDSEEMERLFKLCEEMMTNCFGTDDSPTSHGQHVNLVHDLVEQICQPLHCHHRLHRMAGHYARHIVMWNNEWEEHHSYSLGLFGWLVILALVLFYACAFLLGFDADWGSNLLPSYKSTRQKKKSS